MLDCMKNCNSKTVSSSCKNVHVFANRYSSVLGFIILLLPKCPLCVVAYSSAITLCGTSTLITHTTHHTDWGSYVALGMSVIIIVCILLSYRTKKNNAISLITALCGVLLICAGIFKADAMACYYIGATLLVMATFIYSGFMSRLFERLKNGFSQMNNQTVLK